MSVARFIILFLLLPCSRGGVETAAEWQVFPDARMFASRDQQMLILDAAAETLHVFGVSNRSVRVGPPQLRNLESIAIDEHGGIWIFTDPISERMTWFHPPDAKIWHGSDGNSKANANAQNLLAFQLAYDLYGGAFQLGLPSDAYQPAFGGSVIAALNERKRLCLFPMADGVMSPELPLTGKELPDDIVLGHPVYTADGALQLRGEKGTYLLTRLPGGARKWELVEPRSEVRKPSGRRFPKVGKVEFAEWFAEGDHFCWSGSDFELRLDLGREKTTWVLPADHPLRAFTGKVHVQIDAQGRWCFEGNTRDARQVCVWDPGIGPPKAPEDDVVSLSRQQVDLLEQFQWRQERPPAVTTWARIGSGTWKEWETVPMLKAGTHDLSLRLYCLDPPWLMTVDHLVLSFELDLEKDAQRWIADLGADTFQERNQAEMKLMQLADRKFIQEALKAGFRETRDPEIAFRLSRLLRESGK